MGLRYLPGTEAIQSPNLLWESHWGELQKKDILVEQMNSRDQSLAVGHLLSLNLP